MHSATALLVTLVSYLVGSISFARLMTRLLAPGVDLAKLDMPIPGSDERGVLLSGIGANTAGIVLGAKGGLAVAGLDMLKSIVPMLLVRQLWPGSHYDLIAALAAVVGHNWPIFHGFRGGSGWSTAIGALLLIDSLSLLIVPLLLSIISLALTGQPLVGDLLWPWMLMPWLYWRTGDIIYVWWTLALNLVIALAVIPEIRSFFRYRRLGLLEPYMQAVSEASPRRRGLKRMADRIFLFKSWSERRRAARPWLVRLSGRDMRGLAPVSIGHKALGVYQLGLIGLNTPETWVISWLPEGKDHRTTPSWRSRLANEVETVLDTRQSFAVRSSASIEDGRQRSFAGQFVSLLDVSGLDSLLDAIERVWDSAAVSPLPGYASGPATQGNASVPRMAVIIQEMVAALYAGVAFSCNPVTGLDEVVIEAVEGTGDALVQDGASPMRWMEKWGAWIERPMASTGRQPPQEVLDQIVADVRKMARIWGGPVDMEWAWDGRRLHWLQVRDITGLEDIAIFTNHMSKEFLPGIILPLVWSINAPLVNSAWARFLTEIIGPNDLEPATMARTFLHRAYFAVAPFRLAFERLGMHPESLELIMGIDIGGDDRPSLKPGRRMLGALPRLARFVLGKIGFRRQVRRFLQAAPRLWQAFDPDIASGKQPQQLLADVDRLYKLAQQAAYYDIVTPLIMQIYDRVLRGALKNQGIAYEQLILAREGPDAHLWDPAPWLSRLQELWEALPAEVQSSARAAPQTIGDLPGAEAFAQAMADFQAQFGHLSDSGNDLSVAPWRETPELVLDLVASYQPPPTRARQSWHSLEMSWSRRALLAPIYHRTSQFHVLRDAISGWYTYAYGLLRPYLRAVGEQLAQRGSLSQADDLYYLTLDQVKALVQDAALAAQMQEIVADQRASVASVQDLTPPTLVYGDVALPVQTRACDQLRGSPTSGGRYTGPVCKVFGLGDMAKLQQGDVLVIPYSDVGLTPLFGMAGAVISASGGILSHSSIVAREYGLPAVVSVPGAMDLADGVMVTVDGYLGQILVLENALSSKEASCS